jgi:hypothetical protein
VAAMVLSAGAYSSTRTCHMWDVRCFPVSLSRKRLWKKLEYEYDHNRSQQGPVVPTSTVALGLVSWQCSFLFLDL